jgi:hypothetical protein
MRRVGFAGCLCCGVSRYELGDAALGEVPGAGVLLAGAGWGGRGLGTGVRTCALGIGALSVGGGGGTIRAFGVPSVEGLGPVTCITCRTHVWAMSARATSSLCIVTVTIGSTQDVNGSSPPGLSAGSGDDSQETLGGSKRVANWHYTTGTGPCSTMPPAGGVGTWGAVAGWCVGGQEAFLWLLAQRGGRWQGLRRTVHEALKSAYVQVDGFSGLAGAALVRDLDVC